MIIARALTALVLFVSSSRPGPKPTLRYFKEDHLTGADYLRLSSAGTYDVLGREHMGIFKLDHGTWSAKAETWSFSSAQGGKFKCRVVGFGSRTFLVLTGKQAPSIEIPESEVLTDLKKDPKSTPLYVFFEIPQGTFDRETEKRYPFKYYPEMNEKE